MSKFITGKDGAGGAMPPVSKTVTQLAAELKLDVTDFHEVDRTTLTGASIVYLVSENSFNNSALVILKATADAEGNNPLRAIPKYAVTRPVYVGPTALKVELKDVATVTATSATPKAITNATVSPSVAQNGVAGDKFTFTVTANEGFNINGSYVSEDFVVTLA